MNGLEIRKIIHVDMDAFYAAVEQRDNPRLRNKPVIVGGRPDSRGVVATCSYEARAFGIHSAMPASHARRLCPQAVFIRPRFDVYKQVSGQIREIFLSYTDLVEPLSLDEAYLDVTENKIQNPSATRIAQAIRKQIKRITRLTASAGVSYNKFLAKVASDIDKPDGLTVIVPEQAYAFIEHLPIEKFFGVGPVTAAKMHRFGIRTGKELQGLTLRKLEKLFGRNGEYYYHIARGIDNRSVNPTRIRKSIGKERTFSEDIDDRALMHDILDKLSLEVGESMQRLGKAGRTITLKVKYEDFQSISRSYSLEHHINDPAVIKVHIRRLLTDTDAGQRKVRLLGVTVSNLAGNEDLDGECVQLEFPFVKHLPLQLHT